MWEYWYKYFQIITKFFVFIIIILGVFWIFDHRKQAWQFLLGEVVERPQKLPNLIDFSAVDDEKIGVILSSHDEQTFNQVGFGLLLNQRQVLFPAHLLQAGQDYYFYNQVYGKIKIGAKFFASHDDLTVGILSKEVIINASPQWATSLQEREKIWLWINNEKYLQKVEGEIIDLNKKIKLQKPWGEISYQAVNLIAVMVKSNLGDSGGAVFNQQGEIIGLMIGVDIENEQIGYVLRVEAEKIPLAD